MPAASADFTPAGESSIATQAAGATPRRCAASRKMSGAGLPRSMSSPLIATSKAPTQAAAIERRVHPLGDRLRGEADGPAGRARGGNQLARAVERFDVATPQLGGGERRVAESQRLDRVVEGVVLAHPLHERLNREAGEALVVLLADARGGDQPLRGAQVRGLGVDEHAVEVEDDRAPGARAHAPGPSPSSPDLAAGAAPSSSCFSRQMASRSAWRRCARCTSTSSSAPAKPPAGV